jgi:predicted DNA-binding protein
MRKICVSLALLALIVVLGHTAAQQPDFQAMMKVGRSVQRVVGDNPGFLAANPGVQKELKMDEDQIKAVREKVPAGLGFGGFGGFGKGKELTDEQKEKAAKMMEKFQALADVPEDKLEDKIREVFKDEIEGPTKEVEKILKPEQMSRLKQISRQQGGPAAYLKPENVKDLELKDEQKTKLKEIATELDKDRAELFSGGGGMGGFRLSPETREKLNALTKEATEKATAVLTDAQKSKWKELTGEPFAVQFGGFRPKKDN